MDTDARTLLIQQIEELKGLMISVSTGGQRIQEVNQQYSDAYWKIKSELKCFGIDDPNPYKDLWAWYGKWSSGDLPTYKSRREYIGNLFSPVLDALHQQSVVNLSGPLREPTGWGKVDRQVDKYKTQLETAKNEEDFQSVALTCREAVISLAQAVYQPDKHKPSDVMNVSPTDAKRMLEGFIAVELAGSSNDEVRKYAKSAVDIAVHLQHKRTATFQDAALCAEATTSIVNFIAILSGVRNP